MNITLWGAIFFLISPFIITRRIQVVFNIFLVTIPFTAMALVELDTGKSPFVLSPSLFTAFIFIIRGVLVKKRIVSSLLISALLILVISSITSLLVNALFPFKAISFDPFSQKTFSSTTYPSVSSFTQLLYLIYWIFFIFVVYTNKKQLEFTSSFKTILYTTLFVSVWGISQFTFSVLNISFPNKIFNNSTSVFLQGYLQTIPSTKIVRATSVASEPSILAFYLVPVIFLLFFYNRKGFLIGRKVTLYTLCLSVLCALLSTSTTAYIGLTIIAVYGIVNFLFSSSSRRKSAQFIIASALIFFIIFLAIPFTYRYIYQFTVGKLQSDSFSARGSTVQAALDAFVSNPVFGGSVGPITAFSLPFWLLGSLGLMGFIAFLYFVFIIIRECLKSDLPLSKAKIAPILIVLLLSSLSGFSFSYGLFWMFFILSIIPSGEIETKNTGRYIYG